MAVVLVASFALVAGFLVFLGGNGSDHDVGLDLPNLDLWLLAALLFIAFTAAFPFIMHRCLKLVLGKEREYYADLRAAHLIRDPGAVHSALKHAQEDVSDLLLLSPYLDPLLFHPVVDYSSYRPFQTQPTMMQRMRRLEVIFPLLESAQ
jgi:Zn-dependent protease with chaperone function